MKNKIIIFTSLIFILSCNKNDSNSTIVNDLSLKSNSDIVFETYWFQEKEYVLYFDKNGDGDPINQDVALSLQLLIENSELTSFRDAIDMNYIYLFEDNESYLREVPKILEANKQKYKHLYEKKKRSINTRASPNFLEFWEDCGEVGLTMVGEDNTTRTDNIDDCAFLWEHKNLALLSKSNGGTWNDVISDFDVVPEHAIDGTDENDGLTMFVIYRHKDFPSGACKREVFGTNSGINFESDCLVSATAGSFWCFWGGQINDSISSWRIAHCIGDSQCRNHCLDIQNW